LGELIIRQKDKEAWAWHADYRSERVLLAYAPVRKAQQRGAISTDGVGFSCIRTSGVVYVTLATGDRLGNGEDDTDEIATRCNKERSIFGKKNPGRRKLTGIFFGKTLSF
jgi:hypothetical protein